jgi:hypothetical protein
MYAWRVHLGRVAVLTLTLQVCAIGAASLTLCCGPEHHAPATDEMPCCKDANGAAHVCPLKKAPKPDVPQMEACCTPDQQALAILFSFTSLPEASYSMAALDTARRPVATLAEQPRSLAQPPDSPPPRS